MTAIAPEDESNIAFFRGAFAGQIHMQFAFSAARRIRPKMLADFILPAPTAHFLVSLKRTEFEYRTKMTNCQ